MRVVHLPALSRKSARTSSFLPAFLPPPLPPLRLPNDPRAVLLVTLCLIIIARQCLFCALPTSCSVLRAIAVRSATFDARFFVILRRSYAAPRISRRGATTFFFLFRSYFSKTLPRRHVYGHVTRRTAICHFRRCARRILSKRDYER